MPEGVQAERRLHPPFNRFVVAQGDRRRPKHFATDAIRRRIGSPAIDARRSGSLMVAISQSKMMPRPGQVPRLQSSGADRPLATCLGRNDLPFGILAGSASASTCWIPTALQPATSAQAFSGKVVGSSSRSTPSRLGAQHKLCLKPPRAQRECKTFHFVRKTGGLHGSRIDFGRTFSHHNAMVVMP